MTADPWAEARRELDLWGERKQTAKFWVRDDDASEMSEQLARLHALAERHGITIGLAIIPGKLHPSLLNYWDSGARNFRPMCHGWKHINHGPANKPAEFGRDRPLNCLIEDAAAACQVFCQHFSGSRPIFVPPFNRISHSLTRALPTLGFVAVSAIPTSLDRTLIRLGSRFAWTPIASLDALSSFPRIDVHIDVIDWTSRTAFDTRIIADRLVQQLRGRRRVALAASQPIGLLTHHLVHDGAIWRACDQLLDVLRRHDAVEFIDIADWSDRITR